MSDGGVHSHIRHLFALLETAKEVGVPHVYIHFFGDGEKYYLHTQFTQLMAIKGRDTAPKSATGYAKELIEFIEKEKIGEIGDFFRLFLSHSCALISYSNPDFRTSYCGR